MEITEKNKQEEFMKAYGPLHERFERFCQVRSYAIIDQKDLMNETLCRTYEAWDNIKDKKNLLYFLFGTASNIVKNTIRKKRETHLSDQAENHLQTSNCAEKDLEIDFLYQQLNKLPNDKREAIILFEISGFTIKEIAQLQNTTIGAINMRLKRARKELKILLRDDALMELNQNEK